MHLKNLLAGKEDQATNDSTGAGLILLSDQAERVGVTAGSRRSVDKKAMASSRRGDRAFFITAAAIVIAVVLWGFGFELDDLRHYTSFTPLVQAHGALMFGWIALFFIQVVLVACRRIDWHRRLGVLGAVVAALIVVLGIPTTIVAARLGGDHLPPHASPGDFLLDAISDLVMFSALAASGLALRRHAATHKRLMLMANLPPLNAAIVRLVAYLHLSVGSLALRDTLMLIFCAIDTIRYRRLHPAFAASAGLLLANDAAVSWLAGTPTWARIVRELLS
jgi:hypothetical protein